MSIEEKQGLEGGRLMARPASLLFALGLMALVLIASVWSLRPPAAKPSAEAQSGSEFTAGQAMDLLRELLVEGQPHPAGSANNDLVRERIVAALQDLGYEVELQETVSCRQRSGVRGVCAPVINILAELPGEHDAPAVMVVAHYDSVGAGPGVADDSSSVVEMLEMARILKAQGPHRNSVLFVFTDAEEIGLLGAKGFATEHPWAERVGVAVNLEARGTAGRSLMFETSEGNAWLMDAYAASVRQPSTNSLMYEVYKSLPNDTDLSVFKDAGMPGLNFAFIGQPQHYHTALDNLDYLEPGSVQHQGESILALVRELAARDLSNPPGGDAAYMDVLGLGLIRWPAGWTVPLAAVALLLLLVTAGLLVRRGEQTVGSLLWGLLGALLALVLPILLGLALTWLMRLVTGVERPWFAYPLPARLSLWTTTLLCTGLVAGGLARRAGLWGLGIGVWFLVALLALVLGLTLTGAAIILLVPALLATLLLVIVVLTGKSGSALIVGMAFIVAALAGGLVWLPLAVNFEAALGFDLVPAIVIWVALTVAALAPLFALAKAQRRLGWGLVLASALVVVVAAGIAMLVPQYSDFSPQRLSLYHFEDRDRGSSHEVTVPETGDVPEALRAGLDGQPQTVFPWSISEWFAVDAPPTGAPPPAVEVVAEEASGSGRIVDIRLRSPRGGEKIDLWLPRQSLVSIKVAGNSLPVDPTAGWTDVYQFECYGHRCDGLVLRLELANTDPVEALVVDASPGLPPSGAALLEARPATAVPGRLGDLTLVARRVEF